MNTLRKVVLGDIHITHTQTHIYLHTFSHTHVLAHTYTLTHVHSSPHLPTMRTFPHTHTLTTSPLRHTHTHKTQTHVYILCLPCTVLSVIRGSKGVCSRRVSNLCLPSLWCYLLGVGWKMQGGGAWDAEGEEKRREWKGLLKGKDKGEEDARISRERKIATE